MLAAGSDARLDVLIAVVEGLDPLVEGQRLRMALHRLVDLRQPEGRLDVLRRQLVVAQRLTELGER